jgi:hypothetical protein
MADNYQTNSASGGNTFASDDISSVHYARVKRSVGRDGQAADVGTRFSLLSAASTNATNVKASAGVLWAILATNLNAAVRYLKFHNTAGTPTAGSGVVARFAIPGNTAGAGFAWNLDPGWDFDTGIGITLVTGAADSDSTAVAANELVINLVYT